MLQIKYAKIGLTLLWHHKVSLIFGRRINENKVDKYILSVFVVIAFDIKKCLAHNYILQLNLKIILTKSSRVFCELFVFLKLQQTLFCHNQDNLM